MQQLTEIRNKSCSLTFIVVGGGPCITILGAIVAEKYVV